MKKKLSKKNVARLEEMLYELELNEAKMQFCFGDCAKGSMRATKLLDAEALRAVLDWIKSQGVKT